MAGTGTLGCFGEADEREDLACLDTGALGEADVGLVVFGSAGGRPEGLKRSFCSCRFWLTWNFEQTTERGGLACLVLQVWDVNVSDYLSHLARTGFSGLEP